MKGFTFLELIIAMAILGVLVTLGLLGISTTQRSSRDTERKTVLKAISNELIDYFGNHQAFPPASIFDWNTTSQTLTLNNISTLKLTPATNLLPASETVSTYQGSVYCYAISNNNKDFTLGVSLENGNWYNLGAGSPCSTRTF